MVTLRVDEELLLEQAANMKTESKALTTIWDARFSISIVSPL
jgi:hypothetical protein